MRCGLAFTMVLSVAMLGYGCADKKKDDDSTSSAPPVVVKQFSFSACNERNNASSQIVIGVAGHWGNNNAYMHYSELWVGQGKCPSWSFYGRDGTTSVKVTAWDYVESASGKKGTKIGSFTFSSGGTWTVR